MKDSRKRLNWPESTAISVLISSVTTVLLTLIFRYDKDYEN